MLDNKEIAKLLRKIREKRGIQAQQLARDLNVSKSTVTTWENGERNFDLQLIFKLSNYFHVPISYFTGESGDVDVNSYDPNVVKIPIIGEVKAGYDLLAEQNIVGYSFVAKTDLNGGDYFYLKVLGDSMTGAGINEGDLLLVRRQPAVDEGQIAVILLDNTEVTVKRVYYKGDQVILQSENPSYPPRLAKFEDIKIQGLVKEIKRKVK
jgi:repressor LexA